MEPAPVPFDRLYAHREWVRRVARSLVLDESRAADLEQQAWLAALEHPPREARSLKGWLGTVLRNAAGKTRRSEERRLRREEATPPSPAPPGPDEIVAETEAHERVVRAVLALEEPYKTTVLLRYFEDLAPSKVAARLAVPVETVRTRLRRALEQVRARLDAEEKGDRRAWCLVLLPLARRASDGPAVPAAAGGAAAAVMGGLLVGTAAKAAAAAVVLGIAGYLLWPTPPGGDTSPEAGPVAFVAAPNPAAPPATPLPSPVAAAAAATADPAPAAASGSAVAIVEVTDERGRPIAGAEVVLAAPLVGVAGAPAVGWPFSEFAPVADPPALARSLADASGRAEVAAPRGGWWRLLVRAAGFAAADRGIRIGPVAPENARVLLRPAFSLAGTIRDARGAPVAGAVVLDRGSRDGRMMVPVSSPTTGADGRYRLEGLPRGIHELNVLDPRGILHSSAKVRIPGVAQLDLRIGGGVTVKGRVLDDATGKPVESARVAVTVHAGGRRYTGIGTATTGAEGTFVVADLPPGDVGVEIAVVCTGYRRSPPMESNERVQRGLLSVGSVWEKEIRITPGEDPPMSPQEPAPAPNAAPGRVEGRVLDPAGSPAPGITVAASNSRDWQAAPRVTVTDGSGRFRFEEFPAGRGSLYARPGAHDVGATHSFNLDAGGAVEGIELKLEKGGTISGAVRRADGAAVAAPLLWQVRGKFSGDIRTHLVAFARDEALVPIGPDGTFRLEKMRAGDYVLLSAAEGCEPGCTKPFELADGEEMAGVEIVLSTRESLALAGVVVDDEGHPVAAAQVSTRPTQDRRGEGGVSAVTDAEGRFRVEDLPAGPYLVSVEAAGFVAAKEESRAGVADLRIVVERSGFLSGRVVEQGTGAPVRGLPVRATPEARSDGGPVPRGNWRTTTASDGSFRLEDIRGGTWTVIAGEDGSGGSTGAIPASVKGLEPGAQGIEIAVQRGARIAGRFVDEAGDKFGKPMLVQAMRRQADGRLERVGGEARSTNDGAFLLGGLEPGTFDLWIRPGLGMGDETPPTMLMKGIEAGREDLVVRVPVGLRIRGRISNLPPSMPKGKTGYIRLKGTGESWWPANGIHPKEDGTFASEPLDPTWTYDLEVLAHDVPGRTGALREVRPGAEGVVLELSEGFSISGRVEDEAGAAVGEGVPVIAWALGVGGGTAGGRSDVLTAADGSFRVTGLGDFRFCLSAGGGGSEFPAKSFGSTPEESHAPGAREVVLRLPRGLVMSGRLFDARGKTAPGLLVEALSGSCPKVYTGEDGSFVLKGLAAGQAKLRVGDRILGPFPSNSQDLDVRLPEK